MLNFPRIMDWTNNVFALFSVVVVAATQTSIIRKNYRFSSKSSNGTEGLGYRKNLWIDLKDSCKVLNICPIKQKFFNIIFI